MTDEHKITYRGFEVPAAYLAPSLFAGGQLGSWKAGVDVVLDTYQAPVKVTVATLAPATRYVYYTHKSIDNMVWRFPFGSSPFVTGEVQSRNALVWGKSISRREDFRDEHGFLLDGYIRRSTPPEWVRD